MNVAFTQTDIVSSERILYTPSQFSKANLLHLQEIGSLQALSPYADQREHLLSYLFFIVTAGKGTLKYNGVEYSLSEGQCVFIDCQIPYAHTTDTDLWNLKWIHFYGANMSSIYAHYVEQGGLPVFTPKSIDDFEEIWNQIMITANSNDYIRNMVINENLNALLTRIMQNSRKKQNSMYISEKRKNLQNVKQYLDEHFQEKITLDYLSDHFYMNKHYLGRIFHEQFGISINNYIIYLRVNHAKHLLRFTNLTIEEIANDCGIYDSNYFSRMFKKIEGVSPRAFRQSWEK